jgi:hypothetical protein
MSSSRSGSRGVRASAARRSAPATTPGPRGDPPPCRDLRRSPRRCAAGRRARHRLVTQYFGIGFVSFSQGKKKKKKKNKKAGAPPPAPPPALHPRSSLTPAACAAALARCSAVLPVALVDAGSAPETSSRRAHISAGSAAAAAVVVVVAPPSAPWRGVGSAPAESRAVRRQSTQWSGYWPVADRTDGVASGSLSRSSASRPGSERCTARWSGERPVGGDGAIDLAPYASSSSTMARSWERWVTKKVNNDIYEHG